MSTAAVPRRRLLDRLREQLRPQRKPRLPTVLSVVEVRAVLALLEGAHAVLEVAAGGAVRSPLDALLPA